LVNRGWAASRKVSTPSGIHSLGRYGGTTRRRAPREGFVYGSRQFVLSYPAHLCLVLGYALYEALDDLFSICVVLLAVAALEGHVLGAFVLWHVAGGVADAPENGLFRASH
jgi:hypothetical protein